MIRTFAEHYGARNFTYDTGADAVREFLAYVLNTPKGTRPYYPLFGSYLGRYKYAPLNQTTIREVHAEIRSCINSIDGISVVNSEYSVDARTRSLSFRFFLVVDGNRMSVSMSYSDGNVK